MIKILKHFNKRDWLFTLAVFFFVIIQTWLDLKMPSYMNVITQIAQGAVNPETGRLYVFSDIWANGGFMLLCSIASMISSIITSYFVMNVAANFSARLRELLYKKTQRFSAAEIHEFSTDSLITRSTNDIQHVQLLISMGLQMMIKAPITAVWAITKISGSQWKWSAALGIAVVIMLISLVVVILIAAKKFERIQVLTDDMNRVTRENLSGLRIIRAFNAEDYQIKRFSDVNQEFTKISLFTGQITALLSPIISGTTSAISLIIYWVGALIIQETAMTAAWSVFGDMVVFMSYGMQIMGSFAILAIMFMIAPRALISARRIFEVIETSESMMDGPGVVTGTTGTIEFKNVSFKYPHADDNALFDISFKVEKGETVAIIGSTGCGKTTLIDLIARFYDATQGSILINNHDIRDYQKKDLNRKLAYVSQKALLFSGEIDANINFGDNNASPKQIDHAIEISQSREFIDEKKGDEPIRVAQNGSNFSGGQKQRLSIARALARKAEIYLFDDTFSALDYRTDKLLRSHLDQEMGDATRIIVSQRIGTIIDADLILVIDNGRIVGKGQHSDLIKSCPTYQEIAYSELSKEELANA